MPEPRQGAAAVALRLAGASYHEIADALSIVDAAGARRMVEETLAAKSMDPPSREMLRAEEAGRLERLLRGVWAKATDVNHPEHLASVKIAVGIIDRHIRLHGLDAPAEIIVHTPTMTEIDQWVASVTTATVGELRAMEADVIDAESEEVNA